MLNTFNEMSLFYNLTYENDSSILDYQENNIYEYYENRTNSTLTENFGDLTPLDEDEPTYFNQSVFSSLFMKDEYQQPFNYSQDEEGTADNKTSEDKYEKFKKALLDLIKDPYLAAKLLQLNLNATSAPKRRVLPSNISKTIGR